MDRDRASKLKMSVTLLYSPKVCVHAETRVHDACVYIYIYIIYIYSAHIRWVWSNSQVPERMDLDLESQLTALKKVYEDAKSTYEYTFLCSSVSSSRQIALLQVCTSDIT